jgi:hypothetical protein
MLGLWLCGVLAGGPTSAPQPCDPHSNLGHASGQPTQLSENTYRIRHLTTLWPERVGRLLLVGTSLRYFVPESSTIRAVNWDGAYAEKDQLTMKEAADFNCAAFANTAHCATKPACPLVVLQILSHLWSSKDARQLFSQQ